MIAPRVTSEFWISSLKKRLEAQAIPIFVVQRGDKQAGAIAIRVSNLRGSSKLFIQALSFYGERRWLEFMDGLDSEIEDALEYQKKSDQDLWIIEVEKCESKNFLKEFLLSD